MRFFLGLLTLAFGFRDLSTRRVAIITGGTRGIGRGIAQSLVEDGNTDLLLTYCSDAYSAVKFANELEEIHDCTVKLIRGDISKKSVRDDIWYCFDRMNTPLGVLVHNAGQYVGITADNSEGISAPVLPHMFGSGYSQGRETVMWYYIKLYGEAFTDLCENALTRMWYGGSIVGISSPGCTTQYRPQPGYDLPGSGKCVMEYAMRLFALKAAEKNVNCNVVIQGVTLTGAWHRMADGRNQDVKEIIAQAVEQLVPMKKHMTPRQVGDVVNFLCSEKGRFITGVSLPADGGVHLR